MEEDTTGGTSGGAAAGGGTGATANHGDVASRPGRRRLTLLLAPIVVLTVVAWIGDAIWASLDDEHPLWLISLNTRKRYLALVVPHTSALSFFVVGTIRQVISDPLYYLLGRWYGDSGVRWLERKLGEGGGMVRFMERGFAKASWPMVAIFPNALVCMLAGASGMPVWLFLALNIGGTLMSMALLRFVGDVFQSPLAGFSGFVNDYRLPIIALSVALVVLNVVLQRKRGEDPLESPADLAADLEATDRETRRDQS